MVRYLLRMLSNPLGKYIFNNIESKVNKCHTCLDPVSRRGKSMRMELEKDARRQESDDKPGRGVGGVLLSLRHQSWSSYI